MVDAEANVYDLEFTDDEWEEIYALSFYPFEINEPVPLTRGQWTAIAHMAIGKAVLVGRGRYNMCDEDAMDNPAWVADLNGIANKILAIFLPGDGQL
jgi:hypothetical protein